MWYVYLLKSKINNRHYTGSTGDIERRLIEHNSGRTKLLKFARPFELVYKEEYKTRLESVRRELFLKSGKGREFLKHKLGI